ncbi:hypothetical protein ACFV24_26895 [Nocardia fluminea]|uniref:hypothetical protein n=1 Tax=Nocardia fluminea TaxID=134984 RepID=UPI00366FFBC1
MGADVIGAEDVAAVVLELSSEQAATPSAEAKSIAATRVFGRDRMVFPSLPSRRRSAA